MGIFDGAGDGARDDGTESRVSRINIGEAMTTYLTGIPRE